MEWNTGSPIPVDVHRSPRRCCVAVDTRREGGAPSRARACVRTAVQVGRRPPSRQATVEVDMKGAPARARWIGADDMSEGRSHALHLNEEQT
jgi:hypothetical protein